MIFDGFLLDLVLSLVSVFRSGICVWVLVGYFFWVLFVVVILVTKYESEIDYLGFHYLTWFLSLREVEILPKAFDGTW